MYVPYRKVDWPSAPVNYDSSKLCTHNQVMLYFYSEVWWCGIAVLRVMHET